jgi:diguanylate cyclase (GGDEF)-like protein
MISLKKSLNEIEELDSLFRTSLRCYLSAIESIEECPVEVAPEELSEHSGRLKQIRKTVSADPNVEVLEGSRTELSTEIRRHAQRVNGYFRSKEKEIREILTILAHTAEALTERSDLHAAQFRGLARELESAAQLDSLSLIRKKLSEGVGRLKSYADSMWQQNQASVAQLQHELNTVHRRLEEAETLAAKDPLTGLANRREAERLIAAKIQAGRLFCIMLFDLDGLKNINDRHGHHVGDQVLRTFARRLEGQYRPDDIVCRWGGDEFLVILSSTLRDAIERAADVAEKTRGLYKVQGASGTMSVHVSASVGVAQHEAGETEEDLFARADAFLYRHKEAGVSR